MLLLAQSQQLCHPILVYHGSLSLFTTAIEPFASAIQIRVPGLKVTRVQSSNYYAGSF
jgi:hypothetical protein